MKIKARYVGNLKKDKMDFDEERELYEIIEDIKEKLSDEKKEKFERRLEKEIHHSKIATKLNPSGMREAPLEDLLYELQNYLEEHDVIPIYRMMAVQSKDVEEYEDLNVDVGKYWSFFPEGARTWAGEYSDISEDLERVMFVELINTDDIDFEETIKQIAKYPHEWEIKFKDDKRKPLARKVIRNPKNKSIENLYRIGKEFKKEYEKNGKGRGWWGESERHSKARKYGKADFILLKNNMNIRNDNNSDNYIFLRFQNYPYLYKDKGSLHHDLWDLADYLTNFNDDEIEEMKYLDIPDDFNTLENHKNITGEELFEIVKKIVIENDDWYEIGKKMTELQEKYPLDGVAAFGSYEDINSEDLKDYGMVENYGFLFLGEPIGTLWDGYIVKPKKILKVFKKEGDKFSELDKKEYKEHYELKTEEEANNNKNSKGRGWWGESERHSKARKYGKADFGKYNHLDFDVEENLKLLEKYEKAYKMYKDKFTDAMIAGEMEKAREYNELMEGMKMLIDGVNKELEKQLTFTGLGLKRRSKEEIKKFEEREKEKKRKEEPSEITEVITEHKRGLYPKEMRKKMEELVDLIKKDLHNYTIFGQKRLKQFIENLESHLGTGFAIDKQILKDQLRPIKKFYEDVESNYNKKTKIGNFVREFIENLDDRVIRKEIKRKREYEGPTFTSLGLERKKDKPFDTSKPGRWITKGGKHIYIETKEEKLYPTFTSLGLKRKADLVYIGNLNDFTYDFISLNSFKRLDFKGDDFIIFHGSIVRDGPYEYYDQNGNRVVYKKCWKNLKNIYSRYDYLPVKVSKDFGAHHAEIYGFATNFTPNEDTHEIECDLVLIDDSEFRDVLDFNKEYHVSAGYHDIIENGYQIITDLDHIALSLGNERARACTGVNEFGRSCTTVKILPVKEVEEVRN